MYSRLISLVGAVACTLPLTATATAATAPLTGPVLALHTTAAPRTVKRGGRITFTIHLANRGRGAATEVTVCEQLSPQIGRVIHAGGLHVFDATACRTLATLAAGTHLTIRVVAQIGRHAAVGCAHNGTLVLWAGKRLHTTAHYRVSAR